MEKVAHYVFIDQHLKTSVVGIGDAQGHKLRAFQIDHKSRGLSRLKSELGKLEGSVVVGLEATGFYDWMVDFLQNELGAQVKLGHPNAMQYISKAKNKTDGKDVERGLKLLGTEQFPEAYIPRPEERELRWLLTVRERMVRQKVQVANTVRALLAKRNVELTNGWLQSAANVATLRTMELPDLYRKTLNELLGSLEDLNGRLSRLDKEVRERVADDPLARWWEEVKGIGPQTALALRAYVADPGRFPNRKAIGSYLGLCPRVHNSAETIRHGSIDRQGPPLLRRLLTQVAHVIVRSVPEAKTYYLFLAKRRGSKRAMVAIARKLMVGLHSAWRHKQSFDWARCFQVPVTKVYAIGPVRVH